MESSATEWARAEFRGAELGDARRTARLITLAAQVARSPAGRVSAAVRSSAEQEAAYRLLENRAFDHHAIAAAMFAATARRCGGARRVMVAVDQSTVSIVDRLGTKGLGRTGKHFAVGGRRGAEVMSAVASSVEGVTLGLLSQVWHVRSDARSPNPRHDRRPPEERESGLWMRCMRETCEQLAAVAPETRPWFQLDRGADGNHVLEGALELGADFTVRSAHDRRLDTGGRLRNVVRKSRVLGYVDVSVLDSHAPAGEQRLRRVQLTLRARRVSLRLQSLRGLRYGALPVTVVHAYEARPSRRHPRIEWYLLTNVAVSALEDAAAVVSAYRCRWRVEEFHRAWKSGVCDVESSQLRSAGAFQKWATLLAAVASRAERLKTRSRAEPDAPATTELTQEEVDAAILLSRSKHKLGAPMALEQAVDLIAKLGGYTGRRNSGGPPGPTVIGRGLEVVTIAAAAIAEDRRATGRSGK